MSTNGRLSLQAVALLIACLGALLVFISSVWGIGVSPDSAEYIISARRLDSFSVLFTFPSHWGPGYPVLLAFAHLFADDILLTTRLLQCLLFAANLYLVTWLMMQVADNRQSILMVLASVLFLVSFTTYNIHFFAWSEGPLILLQLISASCLLGYWQRNSLPMLLAAAALAGLALLFRYAGIAWIGASGLLVLCMGQDDFARRFRTAFLYGAVALGPFILWLLANHFLRDETTNREFLVHLVSLQDIKTFLVLVFSWFGGRYGPLLFAVEAGLATSVLYLAFRRSGVIFVRFGILAGVYIAVYTTFILFAKSFMDAYIPLDDRIFVPVYVFLFLLLTASAIRLLQQDDVRQKALAAAMILSLLGSHALSLKPVVSAYIASGTGYLSGYMASLPSLREVRLLRGARVYSNGSATWRPPARASG